MGVGRRERVLDESVRADDHGGSMRNPILIAVGVTAVLALIGAWIGSYMQQSAMRAQVVAESKARLATLSYGGASGVAPVVSASSEPHPSTGSISQRSERELEIETFSKLKPTERVTEMKRLCQAGT